MNKRTTQGQKILDYLRKHGKATTWELSQAARSLNVHKRIWELGVGAWRPWGEESVSILMLTASRGSIVRHKIRKGNVWVTEYRLVR